MPAHPLQVVWKRQRRLRKAPHLNVKRRRCCRANVVGARAHAAAHDAPSCRCAAGTIWGPDARPTYPALTTGDRPAAKGAWHAPTRTARTCAAAQAHSRAAAPRAQPPPGWSPGRPRGCPRALRPRAAAAQPTAAPGGSRMRACSPTPGRAARWPAGSCRSTRQPRTVPPPSLGFNLLPFCTFKRTHCWACTLPGEPFARDPTIPWTNATSTAWACTALPSESLV